MSSQLKSCNSFPLFIYFLISLSLPLYIDDRDLSEKIHKTFGKNHEYIGQEWVERRVRETVEEEPLIVVTQNQLRITQFLLV